MRKIDNETIVEARKLRRDGVEWGEVGRLLGVDYQAIRRRIDPKFAESFSERRKKQSTRPAPDNGKSRSKIIVLRKNEKKHNPIYDPVRDGEPYRDPQAIMMGDPPPGRRELLERHRADRDIGGKSDKSVGDGRANTKGQPLLAEERSS